jgi:hypothetical protein
MPRKKKLSEMALRYQAVYDELYDELPSWKKQAIKEEDTRITNELAKDVARRAEVIE